MVLLDVTMPGSNGIDVARMILQQLPSTKIIFLTMHSSRVIVREAFRVGASAFIVKTCAANDLVSAVKAVRAGTTYVSPEVQEGIVPNHSEELSERQTSVLRLFARGCSLKQIAFELTISESTVEFHKKAIIKKLKLRTTAELTRHAIDLGIAS